MASVSQFNFGGEHATGGGHTASGERELFLRQFSGEVLTAYHQRNVAEQLIYKRGISQGKSAQFPVTGTASAKYFTPGEDILVDQDAGSTPYLNDIKTTERLIKIDRLLVAPVFIDSLDEAMSHYDYRSPFAQELGYALAEHTDDALFRTVIRAANTTDSPATATQSAGGGDILLGATPTTATMIDACYAVAAAMDEANIPKEDRHFVVKPANYYKLVYNTSNLVTAVNKDVGGAGSISKGVVYQVAGLNIWMSNHFDVDDDDGAGTGEPANFSGLDSTDHNTYTYTIAAGAGDTGGVAFHRNGVGMVKLKDLTMESEYIIERQGDLVIAKLAFGAAPLRPDSCFRLALKD